MGRDGSPTFRLTRNGKRFVKARRLVHIWLQIPGWLLFLGLTAAFSWYFWVGLISLVFCACEAVGYWYRG
jgi:hypothetical protein